MTAGSHATMFGLSVSAPFELAGVPPGDRGPDGGRPLSLALADREDLLAALPSAGCEVLSDRRDADGTSFTRVDSHPTAGTFIVLAGEGAYRISADARSAELAPQLEMPAWRWQRALIGQVLPFAAVLNGLEVLHASAVRLGDGAVAITGGSHAGKSTLATTWLSRGAELVADDVVAVSTAEGSVPIVFPGPPLLSVRGGTEQLVGADAVAALGHRIGSDADGARIAVDRHRSDPLPLRGLVVIRRDGSSRGLAVRRDPAPDPRLLLGSTFNFVVRTPERLTAHLALASAMAATVPVVIADVGAGHGPDEIADAVERELGLHG